MRPGDPELGQVSTGALEPGLGAADCRPFWGTERVALVGPWWLARRARLDLLPHPGYRSLRGKVCGSMDAEI